MSTKRSTNAADNEWVVCKGKYKGNPMAADISFVARVDSEIGAQALRDELKRIGAVAYRLSVYGPYFQRRGVNLNRFKRRPFPSDAPQ